MTDTKTIKVGLLGLGTVGTGIYKLIGRRSEEMQQKTGATLEIKKILVHKHEKSKTGCRSEFADRSVERDYRR